jgi:hypothetical protein
MIQLLGKKITFASLAVILSFSPLNAANDLTEMQSTYPSAIVQLFVQVGQFVEKGTLLFEAEAMKMRMDHRAPHDGFVTFLPTLHDKVNRGDIVCILSLSPLQAPMMQAPAHPFRDLKQGHSHHSPEKSPTVFARDRSFLPPLKRHPVMVNHKHYPLPFEESSLASHPSYHPFDREDCTIVALSTTPSQSDEPPTFPFDDAIRKGKRFTSKPHTPQDHGWFKDSLSWVHSTISPIAHRMTRAMALPHNLSETEVIQWVTYGLIPHDPETLMITHKFPKTSTAWRQFLENLLAFNVIAFSGFSHIVTHGLKSVGRRLRSFMKLFLHPLRTLR